MKRLLSIMLMVMMLIGVAAADNSQEQSFAVGSVYVFGSYEQDNNHDNGTEPIEWIVLQTDGTKTLLISKHILDCQPFAASKENVTWENSSIRAWLNGDFLAAAFSPAEQAAIVLTESANAAEHGNAEWPAIEWSNTQDRIFLMSYHDGTVFYPEKNDRRAVPTEYAKAQGASVFMSGHADYWTRSWGKETYDACKVNIYGDFSTHEITAKQGVRPMLWLDTSVPVDQFRTALYADACALRDAGQYSEAVEAFAALGNYSDSAAQANACRESDEQILHVGFHYTFGRYEQDNNTENGAEPIEWLVLANDGEKAMLISRHVLDCQPFAATTEGVTWETSGIRAWLNSDFVMAAFTAAEQEALLPMGVVNTPEHQNPAWPVVDWANTTDTMILLSYQEATSLMTKDSRRGVPTAYAKKQGASVFMSEHADQWLRSAGKETFDACSVNIHGDFATRKVTDKLGVRPVIWLDLSYNADEVAKGTVEIADDLPAWRKAELRALNEQGGYDQLTFMDGKLAPHGTQGATRPDVFRRIGNHWEAVEVKYYDLSQPANCSVLYKEVYREVSERVVHLPSGATQRIILDVTDRGFDPDTVYAVVDHILELLEDVYPNIPIDVVGLL